MKKYDDDAPREYTREEVEEDFLNHVWNIINYWKRESRASEEEKIEGVAHSILVALDGDTSLPKFILAPDPHPDDKQYNINQNEHFYPENYNSDVKCDIAGSLHEKFYAKYKNMKQLWKK